MTADKAAIGARLRELRERPPYWSRQEMARRLRAAADPQTRARMPHVESLAHMIKEWERGRYTPGHRFPNYRALYAHAFEIDEEDLLAPLAVDTLWRPPDVDLSGRFTPDDGERLILAARRPLRVDSAVVDSLGVILAAQRRAEDAVGADTVIEPVRAQLPAVHHLVAEARGPVRQGLVNVAAQWAQFSAWLHLATGRRAEVGPLLDRTLEWAVETGDLAMAGSVTSWRAYFAENSGRYGPMVGMAQAARRYRSGPGRVYDTYQEARGYALMGDARAAERALGEAEEATSKMDPGEARPWEYYYLARGYFDLEHGLAQSHLSRTKPKHTASAAERIAAGLAALPEDMRHAEWTRPYRDAMKAAEKSS